MTLSKDYRAAEQTREGEKDLCKVPSILVAIASYGVKQDHYLAQAICALRESGYECDIKVMSDRDKVAEGAEVIVGLPSKNPFSLPFAHRKLFAERLECYDFFLYVEDDMLFGEGQIRAFIAADTILGEDEVAGFLRSETASNGEKYISTVNTHFRWLPETIVNRGGESFAEFSNRHSGCFMLSRRHLKRAIASGAFLVEPHAGAYGMLESAVADIYMNCGLRRLICISRCGDFIVPHLPNKYYTAFGMPMLEFERYLRAVEHVGRQKAWTGVLFDVETRTPNFLGSKKLYRDRECELASEVQGKAHILVIGATCGEREMRLVSSGHIVTVVPLDAIFGHVLESLGMRVVHGPIEHAFEVLSGERFDAILLPEVLHLLGNPIDLVSRLRDLLAGEGRIFCSISNTSVFMKWVNAFQTRTWAKRGQQCGTAAPASRRKLLSWLRNGGFRVSYVKCLLRGAQCGRIQRWGFSVMPETFASHFLAVGEPHSTSES